MYDSFSVQYSKNLVLLAGQQGAQRFHFGRCEVAFGNVQQRDPVAQVFHIDAQGLAVRDAEKYHVLGVADVERYLPGLRVFVSDFRPAKTVRDERPLPW